MPPSNMPRKADREQALRPSDEASARRPVAPACDIYEEEDALVILADMPGVSKETVSAEVEGGVLTIKGRVADDSGASALYAEYEPADFHRAFALGESLDPAGINATLKDGVLTVRLPKAEQAKTRRIPITGE